MTARREGWVTVAAAAEALTKAGDKIDASNVSRYLARFPEIPQEKAGRCRFVDLAALVAHRGGNVLVEEKRAARELSPIEALAAEEARPVAVEPEADEDEEAEESGDRASPTNLANARLKELAIREKEADWAERIGKLVPDHEVLSLVSGVMATFIGELERQEGLIAARMGRDAAAEFRKVRKAAQLAASSRLVELAQKHLKPGTAALVTGAPDGETEAA